MRIWGNGGSGEMKDMGKCMTWENEGPGERRIWENGEPGEMEDLGNGGSG